MSLLKKCKETASEKCFPRGLGEDSFKDLGLRLPILRVCLWILSAFVILLTVVPSVYLFLWALYGTETVGVLAKSASLRWFVHIFASPEWRESLVYSSVLAMVASGVGVTLLIIHFYCMRFAEPAYDRTAYGFLFLSVTLPPVIYALALRLFGASWGIPEIVLVSIGNSLCILPIQFFYLESAQETLPSELVFAGNTLGATHWRNLLFVYVPPLRKAVWTAFLVGFFFSFDELVVATFVIDSTLVTVPRRLWDQVHHSMAPLPAVISCLLISFYGFLWGGRRMIHWIRRF